jgi:hypothetical protein
MEFSNAQAMEYSAVCGSKSWGGVHFLRLCVRLREKYPDLPSWRWEDPLDEGEFILRGRISDA